jgi:hypothetical protein
LRKIAEASKDDAPKRALKEMMGGTLESRSEINLLEEELPREEWMDFDEEDMTDEQKQVKIADSIQLLGFTFCRGPFCFCFYG